MSEIKQKSTEIGLFSPSLEAKSLVDDAPSISEKDDAEYFDVEEETESTESATVESEDVIEAIISEREEKHIRGARESIDEALGSRFSDTQKSAIDECLSMLYGWGLRTNKKGLVKGGILAICIVVPFWPYISGSFRKLPEIIQKIKKVRA